MSSSRRRRENAEGLAEETEARRNKNRRLVEAKEHDIDQLISSFLQRLNAPSGLIDEAPRNTATANNLPSTSTPDGCWSWLADSFSVFSTVWQSLSFHAVHAARQAQQSDLEHLLTLFDATLVHLPSESDLDLQIKPSCLARGIACLYTLFSLWKTQLPAVTGGKGSAPIRLTVRHANLFSRVLTICRAKGCADVSCIGSLLWKEKAFLVVADQPPMRDVLEKTGGIDNLRSNMKRASSHLGQPLAQVLKVRLP
jgi:hypothetical protein